MTSPREPRRLRVAYVLIPSLRSSVTQPSSSTSSRPVTPRDEASSPTSSHLTKRRKTSVQPNLNPGSTANDQVPHTPPEPSSSNKSPGTVPDTLGRGQRVKRPSLRLTSVVDCPLNIESPPPRPSTRRRISPPVVPDSAGPLLTFRSCHQCRKRVEGKSCACNAHFCPRCLLRRCVLPRLISTFLLTDYDIDTQSPLPNCLTRAGSVRGA